MDTQSKAQRLLDLAIAKSKTIGLAESCTGGLVAASITDLAGASAVLQASLVTYSNAAKMALLDVPETVLAEHGAVSAETAAAMVAGVLDKVAVDMAVSITGIAGPGGGSAAKPVGTVWFGIQQRGAPVVTECLHFSGSRADIRSQAVGFALDALYNLLMPA